MLCAAVLAVAACQRPSPPSFMGRLSQDCAAGDRASCRMLTTLERPRTTSHAARGHPPRRDVDAMLQGMQRAKASAQAERQTGPAVPGGPRAPERAPDDQVP
jgi:hypothetical protein